MVHRLVRVALLVGALLLATASTAAAAPPSPGSAGAGDPVFPTLGNGGYDVESYVLDMTYRTDNKKVDATTTIEATATQSLSRFNLDAVALTIYGVHVNGKRARHAQQGEELVIWPSKPIKKGATFEVDVDYRVDPAMDLSGTRPSSIGGHTDGWFPSPNGFVLGLQPHHAHAVFPSNDIPSDTADFKLNITVPEDLQAVANGELTGTSTAAGLTTYTWETAHPMQTEYLQIGVGKYSFIEDVGPRGVPLLSAVPTAQLDVAEPRVRTTPTHLAFMESQVGRYPYESYGVFVGEASIGYSLETHGMSTFSTPTPSESTMVHELSHQWFANSVSPRTWGDVWQNEGHATWYADIWTEQHGGQAQVDRMKAGYALGDKYRADWGPVARPKSPETLFSQQVYRGGALPLFALREVVGADKFDQIERTWVSRYRDDVASTRDFIDLAIEIAGNPTVAVPGDPSLRSYLEDWLYGTKTPPMAGHLDWVVNPV